MSEKTVSAIGLDVGTSRIVTAKRNGDGFQYATQLNAFVDLPPSKLTEATLRREGVPHSVHESRIVVYGSESARFADLLGVEMRRSMSRGVLNAVEPESLTQIRRIVELVTGRSQAKNQKLCFTVPAAVRGAEENLTYHEASLRQMLTDLGYEVRSINEGLAVVYAELESSNYTGIGVSFGGGLCNVCLAYLSVPVVTFAVAKAGDYIDASAAAAAGEQITRVRLRKEDTFYFNGTYSDKALQALTVYYDDMVNSVVSAMREQFAACAGSTRFKRAVPIVLSGGTAMPKGFRERFEAALQRSPLPLEVSEIRLAASPLETTAKGALIAAVTDTE
jgi:hypothetical protein